jgi:hypothetical protein
MSLFLPLSLSLSRLCFRIVPELFPLCSLYMDLMPETVGFGWNPIYGPARPRSVLIPPIYVSRLNYYYCPYSDRFI